MADELTTKRIINLPAESAPAAGDAFVVDNETTGTKKLPVTSLIDATPTEGSAKAVSSGGTWTALNDKVDKVEGKGLSTNDYSDAEKQKVDNTAADLSAMNTATASDAGKALKAKTVSGGKVTEWEFGETGDTETLEKNDTIFAESLFGIEYGTWVNGKFINAEGAVSTDANAHYLQGIDVREGDTCRLTISSTTSLETWTRVHAYSGDTWLSQIIVVDRKTTAKQDVYFVIPEGADNIKISTRKENTIVLYNPAHTRYDDLSENIDGKINVAFEKTDKQIADLASYFTYTQNTIWYLGTIMANSGVNSSSTTRLRCSQITNLFSVEVLDGYKMRVFAYDGATFIGAWTGTEFIKVENESSWLDGKVNIREVNSDYKYRIVIRRDDSADITVEEGENIILTYCVFDGYVTWEQGSFDGRNGDAFSSTTRIRSGIFSDSISSIVVDDDYAFLVYAWDKQTKSYVGVWDGTEYIKAVSGLLWVQKFDLDYTNYYYRIAIKLVSDENIGVDAAKNVAMLVEGNTISELEYNVLCNKNDITALKAEKDVPDKDKYKDQLVFTLGYMYVRRSDDTLYLSIDGGYTFTKSIAIPSGFGTLKNVYVFLNGTMLICDHQNAWYTDNWTEWHQSTCIDQDGTTYVPTQYNTFSNTNRVPRMFVNGTEIYVFGNYNIDDEPNNRSLIWYTVDNGHTMKVAYEFNVSGAMSIRHVHGVTYCEKQNNFWVYTGDSATQSRLIKGEYDVSNDSWTFTQAAQGLDFKWASLVIRGDYFYYCHDLTPGDIMKAKVGDEADVSKHYAILSNLPNDPIGLFVGQKTGELLVTLSMYRTGTSTSTNSSAYDSKRMWFSGNGVDFVEIDGNKFIELTKDMNSSFYMFCGPNAQGDIICGYEKSAASGGAFKDRDLLPSVSLTDFVKRAGYDCDFS